MDALAPAEIVEPGGILVVLLVGDKVGIETEILLELFKPLLRLRASKQFLPDETKHLNRVVADELLNLMANWVARSAVATEETRPDASVNDDIHRAPRSFL